MPRNDDVPFVSFSSLKLPPPPPPTPKFDFRSIFAKSSLGHLIDSIKSRRSTRPGPILCSASLSLTNSKSEFELSSFVAKSPLLCSASLSLTRSDDSTTMSSERVLIRNNDGEDLERKDLELEALGALKACRDNLALIVREVQKVLK